MANKAIKTHSAFFIKLFFEKNKTKTTLFSRTVWLKPYKLTKKINYEKHNSLSLLAYKYTHCFCNFGKLSSSKTEASSINVTKSTP